MKRKRIDAMLISSWNRLDINLKYLADCGIEHSFFIYPKKGNSVFLVPGMELERSRSECRCKVMKLKKDFKTQIASILRKKRVKRLGINYSLISLAEYRAIRKAFNGKIVDSGRLMLEQRMLKTPSEIALYRKACRMTDDVMNKTIANFGRFRSEADAVQFLKEETEKRGCEFSFPPIVASGKRGSMPHYSRRQKFLKGFVVIDYGLKYKGYCTDITRTIYIGEPSEKELADYRKVLSTQEECINMIKTGMKASEPYDHAKKMLGKRFNHGLGHGVGLQIHELPNISPASKERFTDGMVFTIEPGLYIKGKYGIRIEDDVLIKDGRPVVLTKTTKKLIRI
jgi:Xaa-Pro aminopeptidase